MLRGCPIEWIEWGAHQSVQLDSSACSLPKGIGCGKLLSSRIWLCGIPPVTLYPVQPKVHHEATLRGALTSLMWLVCGAGHYGLDSGLSVAWPAISD